MNRMLLALTAALALLGSAALASASDVPAPLKVHKTSKGEVLTDAKGMTLYTFDKDTKPGKSVCNGKCATNWPPLHPVAGAEVKAPLSVITRDDGSKQLAYKGMPLYLWVKDKKAGDVTGDGVGKVWKAAKP